MSNEYWAKREATRIKERQKLDAKTVRKIVRNQEKAYNDIEQQINAFYAKYADSEGISWADAKKRIDRAQSKSLQVTVEDMAKRATGNKDAEAKIKLYNAAKNVNRYSQLLAGIGLRITEMSLDDELLIKDTLMQAFREEVNYLKKVYPFKALGYNDRYAEKIVYATFHNATFSDRIWSDHDALKSKLDSTLRTMLTRGENPRKYSREFKKAFDVSKSDAERLLLTESARVQSETMMDAYEDMGFAKGKWITESDPCDICKSLKGEVKPIKDLRELLPRHPRCRCSVAPYQDRAGYEKKLGI